MSFSLFKHQMRPSSLGIEREGIYFSLFVLLLSSLILVSIWWPLPVQEIDLFEDALSQDISRAYIEVLHRKPDAEGLVHFRKWITSGEGTLEDLKKVLENSEEKQKLTSLQRNGFLHLIEVMGLWIGVTTGLYLSGCWFLHLAGTGNRFGFFQHIWVGFGLWIAFLEFISTLLPLNEWLLGFFGGVTLILGIWKMRKLYHERPCIKAGNSIKGLKLTARIFAGLAVFSICIVVIELTNRRGSSPGYDTLLYHWNIIRWNNSYPAVPGLANLHIRLGTSSAWLLLISLFDQFRWDGGTAWLFSGYSQCLWMFYLVFSILNNRHSPGVRVFAICLFPLGMQNVLTVPIGLYFDKPANIFLLVAVQETVILLSTKKNITLMSPLRFLPAASAAAVSFVIKPIGVVWVGAILLALAVSFCVRILHFRSHLRPLVFGSLPFWVITGWLVRNAILTGWLFFPTAIGGLPVDWKVPEIDNAKVLNINTVVGQRSIIQAWARKPGVDYALAHDVSLSNWIPDWWGRNQQRIELQILLPLIVGGLPFLVFLLYHREWAWGQCLMSVCWVIGSLNLVFWFLQAPDLRFGQDLFWILTACTLSAVVGFDESKKSLYFLWRIFPSLFFCVLFTVGWLPWKHQPIATRNFAGIGQNYSWGNVMERFILDGDHDPVVYVNVPKTGDQCRDAELPCTPYPRKQLQARAPGNLRKGYRIVE